MTPEKAAEKQATREALALQDNAIKGMVAAGYRQAHAVTMAIKFYPTPRQANAKRGK